MQKHGIHITPTMALELIQSCSRRKDLVSAQEIYSILSKDNSSLTPFIRNHIIRMFTACGSLMSANEAFFESTNQDSYSWNAIISAHAKLGNVDSTFDMYNGMQRKGIKPSAVTFLCVLKACYGNGSVGKGRVVHDDIIRSGLERHLALGNALINMYAKCGSVQEARCVFNWLPDKDSVSWGAMLTGYVQHEYGIVALELLEIMHVKMMRKNKVVYLSSLKACTITCLLELGRQIHYYILLDELEADVQLGSALVEMYGKCGSLREAHRVFDGLPSRDVVLWSSLISGYVRTGFFEHGFQLFEEMQSVPLMPDRAILICILKACGGVGNLNYGLLVHDKIIKMKLEMQKPIKNSLLDMYAKCGDFHSAHVVFDMILQKDVVTWGALMSAYVQHGHDLSVLYLYGEMHDERMLPDKGLFLLALNACTRFGALMEGKLIYQHMMEVGVDFDLEVADAVIEMYSTLGQLEEACIILEHLPNKRVESYSIIVEACSNNNNGFGDRAFQLFEKVRRIEFPSKSILLSMLKVCRNMKALQKGRYIHDEILRGGWELEEVIKNTLIDMYAKFGSLAEARKVFNGLPKCNIVSWGAMISGYVLQGKGYLALKLFEEMLLQNVEPNEVTLSGALAACSNVGAMEEGKLIYDSVIRNGTLTTIISNTLVDMYGKFGLTEEAENVFKGFSDHNVISWGTLIAGYTMQSNGLKALDLYKKMLRDDIVPTKPVFLSTLQASALVGALEEGQLIHVQITESGYEADVVLGNTLIDMYAKCGKLHEACNVFASLESRDMVSWSAMMSGFIWNDKCKEVDRCFQSMQKHGLKAAQFIFTNILDACNHSGFLVEGLRYFRWMTQVHGFSPDLNHYSCMSDVLGRGGCLLEAIDLLHTMPKVPDIISWTSLLVSCRIHGNRKLASKCFQELLDREPNEGSWYVLISEIYGDYSYTSTETSLNPRDKCAYLYSLLGVNENFPHSVIKKALVDLP